MVDRTITITETDDDLTVSKTGMGHKDALELLAKVTGRYAASVHYEARESSFNNLVNSIREEFRKACGDIRENEK